MEKPVTLGEIEYICRYMLGLDWRPYLRRTDEVLSILSRCQSKLEIMCILGMGYYFYKEARKFNPYYSFDKYPLFTTGILKGQQGIDISSVFLGYEYDWYGPFSVFIIPQFPSPQKPIHHDLGLYFEYDDGRMKHSWLEFICAVEIDGYGVHRKRRQEDERRLSGLPYPIIRVYEEQTEPHNWLKLLADQSHLWISEHLSKHTSKVHPCQTCGEFVTDDGTSYCFSCGATICPNCKCICSYGD
jgi:hypothetical protein